ncbi:hypothetical protein FEG63_04450 [Mycolicibacterium sphagni]|uniref:Uncharacterized protein n=1 Tax=Mycolicibacterium sphagni TaxID=1786 RepID=A0ABX2JV98_9MYCO|nr:hypothetical protein [Mycolicibacterium sphagni]NTY58801.1 hypothetical protein [Mycolicibacterium sphagni]
MNKGVAAVGYSIDFNEIICSAAALAKVLCLLNCGLPSKQPRVRGAAPDAGAIIACRHHPGCLAWYVNGGGP